MGDHTKVQMPFEWDAPAREFTVSGLTEAIRGALGKEFTDIWVSGEISGCKTGPSGHVYFTLKDANAQIRCALFARTARIVRFKPRDGVEVLLRGRVDVYAPRGEYQFLVDAIEPRGYGQLQLAFEQLKQRLAQEGLFAAERKRPLPAYARRIGIVTSPTGAVIRDMVNILTRRFPGLHIRLYPAQVQGPMAVEQVVRGIEHFSRDPWAEVIIVARGGGSLEDLWTFNEEAVARAIAQSRPPVISAIGHETDFTIADFAADLRAPTPSAAAELVVPTREQVGERIDGVESRARQAVRYRLALLRRLLHQLGVDRAGGTLHRVVGKRLQRVDELDGRARERLRLQVRLLRARYESLDGQLQRLDLRLRLAGNRRRWEAASERLEDRMERVLERLERRLDPLEAHLFQLSPLRVLDRGYAIVQTEAGAVVKDPAEVSEGEALRLRLAKGEVAARVSSR